uniref:C2H2-type domain-containing protein n=1 Tax=Panagrolaimus sp. ES5 TaxID=591445 RepID=A0AC34FWI5_9BILA
MFRQKNGEKKIVCSFPEGNGVDHKDQRPFAANYIVTFDDAELFMRKQNKLIQVGLHCCSDHKDFLNSLKEKSVSPTDKDDSDDTDSQCHSGDNDYITPGPYKSKPEQKVSSEVGKAISQLAKAAGIPRTGLHGAFSSLADETKRKKVEGFGAIMGSVASYMAPDAPEALIQAFCEKRYHATNSSLTLEELLKDTAEWFYVANDYREKTEVLAQIAMRFRYEQIREFIPDLTLFRFTAARKLALRRYDQWKQPVMKTIKVRYDKEYINLFVDFITSPFVMVDLPFGTKKAKLSSGEKFEIPNTLRKHHKREIINMFHKYLIEMDRSDVKLSYSTMNKILDICVASQKISMQYVDYFVANGDEAFDSLFEIMDSLDKSGLVEETWKKDLRQLFLEAKNYLKTDYRMNVKINSSCPDHCIVYSLSDPTNSNFCAIDCNELTENGHQHQSKCDRCSILPNAISKIVEKIDLILSENENDATIQEQLSDFKEMIAKNEKAIEEQKQHYLRSVYSDTVRSDIIDNLKEGEAFVTMDYIMKFIPTKNLQTQRDWYAQKGNSWHCSHIFARIGGKIVQHSIIHILGFEKQDARVVTTIVRDLLTRLKSWNIHTVSFRADNASCYHNTELLVNLFFMAGTIKINVKRFSFSEAQNGKSSADTEAARLKRIIRNWIDSGHNVETIFDMFNALQSGTIPLCALTVVVAKVVGKNFEAKNTLTGISKISDVTFDYEKKELRYWQYFNIGEGQIMKVSDYLNLALNAKLEILQTTNHDPNETGYLFWRPLHLTANEVEKSEIEQISIDARNLNENEMDLGEQLLIADQDTFFSCPVDGCQKSFIKFGNLQRHFLIGKHQFPSDKCTLNDYAIKEYARKIEGITPKLPELLKLTENISGNDDMCVKKGWAIKKPASRTTYTADMKKFLDGEFKAYQDQGKRIDPKDVQKKMAEIKNSERKTRFKPTERLSSMQIGRYFVSKLNKLRGAENAAENEGDTH